MRRFALCLLFLATAALAQQDPALFQELRWRAIGPFRGGRTVAGVGIPSQPHVFYIGVNNGGVWKTTDAGRTWIPIFDDQPTGSIGAIAVAPSDPNIVYAGSGEGLQRPDLSTGDGIYRSSDAGKTWTHYGLRDGQQIPVIAVDPRDPNRLFVAVLGHPYGPNAERGIFRSADGGKTFEKVLYKDENTGAIDVIIDPSNPQTVYAALWEQRQGPWENGVFTGPGSGVYKSTDGGTTWKTLNLGAEKLGRVGLEVCAADPKRLYAVVDAKNGGLYGSRDGGESWTLINNKPEIWERGGDFNEVRADPKNADIIYIANVVTWKSSDGGKSFDSFRGAPGGDDYHRLWINPNDTNIILNASDQGAIVTLNGGESWSSWYNQPTAQMFHVNADNAFPYRVCGGQQESGSACVQTRGDDGRITDREWHPASVEEYGYAVPDPLDPDLVYGGKITRWDRRTGQVQAVGPKPLRSGNYRTVRTQPVVFSPADPHVLFFAANTVWRTSDGAQTWTEISPDLTRKDWPVPANVGIYAKDVKVAQRGVVYALAPSPLDVNLLWAGTDDGLLHVTRDGGKTWTNVTPPSLAPWAKVSILEASHFDANEAYAAINTLRLDDLRPHILRTKDGGKTWTEVVSGIASGGIINVVREDPKKRGLLFAGSETNVYVSFDDGDHWQSLRLNMPATSIRDLVLHGDDLIAGTHGRGFWVLDDVEPLRQIGTNGLLRPQQAIRFRWNKNPDTPLPPDEPAGQNGPDGAVIDYVLPSPASVVELAIIDANNQVLRRYSSRDKAEPPKDEGNIPWYWIRPPRVLSTAPGMHRFLWDLHLTPVPTPRPQYPIAATPHDTAPVVIAPWVPPGQYTVQLIVDGHASMQPLTVVMDPRVKTPAGELQQQYALSRQVWQDLMALNTATTELRALRAAHRDASKTPAAGASGQSAKAPEAELDFEKRAAALEGEPGGDFAPPRLAAGQPETINSLAGALRTLLAILQSADALPNAAALAAVQEKQLAFTDVMKRFGELRGR
ncbi:MAG TPA: glycoside hydrolase [Thermoanaerobaculia bacterium]|jgi:photosystem II stability/assembly factor-like uncharacterized protein